MKHKVWFERQVGYFLTPSYTITMPPVEVVKELLKHMHKSKEGERLTEIPEFPSSYAYGTMHIFYGYGANTIVVETVGKKGRRYTRVYQVCEQGEWGK